MEIEPADAAGPDLAWTTAQLLDAAEAAQCLSAGWLLPLSVLDPAGMTSAQRVQWTVSTNRLVAVAEELALRAMASVPLLPCATADDQPGDTFPDEDSNPTDRDGPRRCPGGIRCPHSWEVEELAALTQTSRGRVATRRQWGTELAGRFQVLQPLLATGGIGLGHLISLSHQLAHCCDDTATAVAAQVVARAPRQAPAQFARSVARALSRCLSPEEAAARHTSSVTAGSGVAFYPREDGLLGMGVTGSVERIEAIRAIFGTHPAITRPTTGDTRTTGQRQVDFLLDACTQATTGATNPTSSTSAPGPTGVTPAADPQAGHPWAAPAQADPARGQSPGEVAIGVVITASLETLEGTSNEPGLVGDTSTDAATIRHLAAERQWARAALYDRRGIIVDLGRAQRFPNRSQRIAVGVKNPRCTFPGCSRSATGADIDHTAAWAHGGRTDLANLSPLCKLHHHLKHQPGWSCHPRRDGSLLWTLPHGQTIVVEPHDHRPPTGPHDRTHHELTQDQQEANEAAEHHSWVAWAIDNDPENLAATPP